MHNGAALTVRPSQAGRGRLSSLLALIQIRRTLQFQLRISIQMKTHDRQVAEDAELGRLRFGPVAPGIVIRQPPCTSRSFHLMTSAYGAAWEVASCNAGTSAPAACERALCDIVRRLQQGFDIAPT